jgi:glycosyltransferase involved in cell wall biosynthesis
VRILFLNHNVAWSGGTFHRAFHVGRHLVRRGHDVTLVSISPDRRLVPNRRVVDGVTVIESPDLMTGAGRTGWDPWDALWRAVHLRGSTWDVLHAWDSRPVVVLPALTLRGRTRLWVMDWCDWWGRGGTQAERTHRWAPLVAPVETFFEEAFRRLPRGTTVISNALHDRAVRLGVDPGSIMLLRQGCEEDDGMPLRDEARRALGLPGGARLLVFVGKLIRSDAALLFATVERLLGRRPDCWFALIGRHGAVLPRTLREHPRLRETGFVSDEALQLHTAAADALLVPLADTLASRARWPSKINSFLAAGRTVITTRVGDLPQLLAARNAGIVVEPDATALADAAVALLDDGPRQRKIERAAWNLAATDLAWSRIVEALETFYLERLQWVESSDSRQSSAATR